MFCFTVFVLLTTSLINKTFENPKFTYENEEMKQGAYLTAIIVTNVYRMEHIVVMAIIFP